MALRVAVVVLMCVFFACDSLSDDEAELAACEVTSECVLAPSVCCGRCGELTLEDVVPINDSAAQVHHMRICGEDFGCPTIACLPVPPTVMATCEAGQCTEVLLAEHPAFQCNSDSDCRVRAVSCCECGARTDPGALVAISDERAFVELRCDPDFGCDDCAPSYPPEAVAACEAGHCVLRDSRMF
ncbi:MAG: hypothetical protein OXT09_11510 [Myxococcales bacterium]|nr:hypothetical protein [Myxococcales bacterium]